MSEDNSKLKEENERLKKDNDKLWRIINMQKVTLDRLLKYYVTGR